MARPKKVQEVVENTEAKVTKRAKKVVEAVESETVVKPKAPRKPRVKKVAEQELAKAEEIIASVEEMIENVQVSRKQRLIEIGQDVVIALVVLGVIAIAATFITK